LKTTEKIKAQYVKAVGCKAKRHPDWSESIAAGSRTFVDVDSVEEQLGSKATGMSIIDRGINGSAMRAETDTYIGAEVFNQIGCRKSDVRSRTSEI